MIDFAKKTNYSKRRMFLDKEGAVSIQRYDEYAYPKQAQYTKAQRGAFWIPDEYTLTKDKIDYDKADEATKFIFTSNLLRQTALDSIQGRSPVQIFTPVSSVPETEAWALWWSAFEQIHSESYSHIIRNIYKMPSDQFNMIHDTGEIINMLSGIDKYYQALHDLNSFAVAAKRLERDIEENPYLESALRPAIKHMIPSEHQHVKAIYLALIASYGLEAIRFNVSFCTSLGMEENKLFIGNGNIIKQILADEQLHTDVTAWQINTNVRDDERFADVASECKAEVRDMLISVIDEEKAWAKYQMQKGTVLGLNERILCSQVDWTAQARYAKIGVKYDAGVKSAPLPWMNKHMNTNKTQTALQENESVSYIIGALSSEINYNDLPNI